MCSMKPFPVLEEPSPQALSFRVLWFSLSVWTDVKNGQSLTVICCVAKEMPSRPFNVSLGIEGCVCVRVFFLPGCWFPVGFPLSTKKGSP